MLKTIQILLLIFLGLETKAGTGTIVVHKAPLLAKPDLTSKVMQILSKGEIIYIHQKHFSRGPLESSELKKYRKEITQMGKSLDTAFYLTLDKSGQDVYVPAEYVKLIFHDQREQDQAVTPFRPDPTDYRLPEPLPEGYPLVTQNHYRGTVNLIAGPGIKSNYPYTEFIEKENIDLRSGFQFAYMKNARWDKENRFYFGGTFQIWSSRSEYTLFNDTNTVENQGQLSIGPTISYDTWRNEDYLINLGLSINLSLNRIIIEQKTNNNISEKRTFSGYSWNPKISSSFHFRDVFSNTNLIIGAELQLMAPMELKSSKVPNSPELWNELNSSSDSISYDFYANWNAFVGFQVQY